MSEPTTEVSATETGGQATLALSAPTLTDEVKAALNAATRAAHDLGRNLGEAAQAIKAERVAEGETAALAAEEADISEVGASGAQVRRLISDIEEALRQVFVAGLSYPDPELPDELDALVERAKRHGLPGALEHLSRLSVWIQAISAHSDMNTRYLYAEGAWAETQRLVTWLRLFKVEFDFLAIESNLTTDSTGDDTRRREKAYPTTTMTVWPVGLELSGGGMLLVFGRDVDSEQDVVLRDQLAEYDRSNPIHTRAISRLFQDAIELDGVMSGLVRLEDHPVVTRNKVRLFRPAFRAKPRLLGKAENFVPPTLPVFDEVSKRDGPSSLRVPGVHYRGGRLFWDTPVPVEPDETLRLNMAKLLAREGCVRLADFDLVVRPKEDALRILSCSTEDDGRVFICHDPGAFRISDVTLSRSAEQTSGHLADLNAPEMVGLFLKAAAYMFGGGGATALDDLKPALSGVMCEGLDEYYGLGLVRFLTGAELPADEKADTLKMIRGTLELATLGTGHVPLKTLAMVLGRSASSADLELLEDIHVYEALWLALQYDLVSDIEPELAAVVKAYKGNIRRANPGGVCARALARWMKAVVDEAAGTASAADKAAKAREFLNAHLADLTGRRASRRRSRASLAFPELLEMFQLADTGALLNGHDRRGATVALLGIPQMKLAQMCVDALFAWRTDVHDRKAGHTVEAAIRAAEAMLIIAAAGLRPLIIL